MPMDHIRDDKISRVEKTTFDQQDLKEREVQNLLKHKIELSQ